MLSNNGHLNEASASEGADDFKRISGIKAAIERRLHSAGIRTYAQLAAASPADIVARLADLKGFSVERVVQLDWANKAAALAREAEEEAALVRRHYASFKVELGLTAEGGVRSTRVVYIQGGDEQKWAGWDAAHLGAVIAAYAGLPHAEPPTEPLGMHEPPPQPPRIAISKIEAVLNNSEQEQKFLQARAAYRVMVALELAQALDRANTGEVAVTVVARNLGSNQRHVVGEARAKPLVAQAISVTVAGKTLAPGTYRLEARASLLDAPADDAALFKGGLLQIL